MVHIVYISKDGNNYESVFSGMAAKVQVTDIPPNSLIYVSKDGNNYESVFSGMEPRFKLQI